ncbi:HlyD family secretion protein [Microbulbifer agarilyticus]|uniref:HlyD family secretion protein n=1 Tax=Microbulbifer agarilyticus TaxID=260552 RepID=UPI001CD25651|nr:HlyD family secretion protein [Microbulbifer agarilyticus]MCA0893294.1 HlyD family secretion protein [Microbulbifer agarilyticus]
MNETPASTGDAQPTPASAPPTPEPPEPTPAAAVGRGVKVVVALLLLSLCWYLMAARFTPYTSQARLQGYVVGVAPKVAGVITDLWVSNNQQVTAGAKLFAIDRSRYELALQSANANFDNTWQQVAAGDSVVEQARASQRAAVAKQLEAQQDYSRLTRLWKDDPGTISVRRLEISRAGLERASAQVAAADAAIQQAIEQKGGDNEASNTLLQAARVSVDQAQLDLDNTIVLAEAAGVITDLRTEVGLYANAGTPVLTLISSETMWINADFTENNLGHLQVGTPVEILLDALPGQVLKGKVRDIGLGVGGDNAPAPGVLPTIENNRDWLRQAQRFPVRIEFSSPLPPDVQRQLRVGGQASVIAYTEGHGFLRLLGKLYIRILSYLSFAY